MSLWFVLQQEQTAFLLAEELFHRINEDNYEDTLRLIESGADVNRCHGVLTPLHYACFTGKHSIASALVTAGAQVNTRDFYECTPLHYAAQAASVGCVKTLLENGANIDDRSRGSLTPLHFACASSSSTAQQEVGDQVECCATDVQVEETVRTLLERGANVNALTNLRDTPLHFAAISSRIATMRALLDFGARVDIRNSVSFTPLLLCAVRFCELREHGSDVRNSPALDSNNNNSRNGSSTSEHLGDELVRVRNCLKLLILASGQPKLTGLNDEALKSRRVATLLERLCCNARPLFALARHSVRNAIAERSNANSQVNLPGAIETLTLPRRIKEHILLTYL